MIHPHQSRKKIQNKSYYVNKRVAQTRTLYITLRYTIWGSLCSALMISFENRQKLRSRNSYEALHDTAPPVFTNMQSKNTSERS